MSIRHTVTAAAAAVVIALSACGADGARPPSTTEEPQYTSLPPGTDTLEVGETWLHDMHVGCGTFIFFNDTWWAPTETTFTHPDYPADWPVDVLNQAPVDGPDAVISATITLTAERRIDIRLADGRPVAVYEPTTEVFFCG